MKVAYDWDIEELTLDEHAEIVDHWYADSLANYPIRPLTPNEDLTLVRYEYTDIDGEQSRYWAYVRNGKLPEFFSDAYDVTDIKVPQKFHKELSARLKAHPDWLDNMHKPTGEMEE
jgi:hypothetical protein